MLVLVLAIVGCLTFGIAACGGGGKDGLKSVTITNKTELTAEWKVGDADRTVNVSLSPDTFTTENTTVTITSNKTAVVQVDGMKLKAVGEGEATITAKAEGKTDTVKITVKAKGNTPALESVTITNKTALTEAWKVGDADRTVTVALAPDTFTTDNTTVTITSSQPTVVKAEGMTLKAVGAGEAIITATAGEKTDTVTITVTAAPLTAPTITLEDETLTMPTDLLIGTNPGTAIPNYTAAASDGTNLTAKVVVSCENEALVVNTEDGILECTTPGTYTLKFTVEDDRGEGLTAEETMEVTVYRRVLAWQDNTWTVANETGDAAEQTISTNNGGFQTNAFNLTPGKYYYAEATMKANAGAIIGGTTEPGFAHLIFDEEGSRNDSRWIVMMVDRGDRNFYMQDFTAAGSWQVGSGTGPYIFRLKDYIGLNDPDPTTVKIATARVGDFFYFFLNGQYVGGSDFEFYRDKDTVPGIFNVNLNNGIYKDIDFVSGEEAVKAKLDAIFETDGAQLNPYVPNTEYWQNPAQYMTDGETTENGVNLKFTGDACGENGGIISPYIWFTGSFTFEWDYKNTSTSGNDQRRMVLEMRDWKYGPEVVQFGMDMGTNKILLKAPLFNEADGPRNEHEFDNTEGAHFKFTRIMNEDHALIIMEANSIANPEQYFIRTFKYAPTYLPQTLRSGYTQLAEADRWKMPVLISLKNKFAAGDYSNIKWSTEVTDPSTLTNPTIEIAGESKEFDLYTTNVNGAPEAVPAATVKASDGLDLSTFLTFKSEEEGITFENGTFLCTKSGTYHVTYSVTDPRNTACKTEIEVTFHIYRRLLGWTDNTFNTDDKKADAEQTVTTTNTGFGTAILNVAPSKLYYAEVTYEFPAGTALTNGNRTGLQHRPTTDDSGDYWISAIVDRGDGNAYQVENNRSKWNPSDSAGAYSWQIGTNRGLNFTSERVTIAIAREGDYFHLFSDGQHVNTVTLKYYRDKDTVPAIFCHACGAATMKNIVVLQGEEATAKINEVLADGAGYIGTYSPHTWAHGSINKDNDHFTVGEVTQEKGINFTYHDNNAGYNGDYNGGMVSPYVYFDGDFTFEWEYKGTSHNDSIKEPRMVLEVRNEALGPSPIQFGADYKTGKVLLNARALLDANGPWNEKEFDTSKTVHFKLTRKLEADKAVFTLTAYTTDKPEEVMTRTFEWKNSPELYRNENDGNYQTECTKWDQPVILLWHNTGVAGEYTNITWKTSVTD